MYSVSDYVATVATRREAIASVRSEADALIEQATRRAKGFDRGAWRDDCPSYARGYTDTIARRTRESVATAFALSRKFTA